MVPLAALVPFLFVLKEGFAGDPAPYFGLWAIGLAGLVLATLTADDDD